MVIRSITLLAVGCLLVVSTIGCGHSNPQQDEVVVSTLISTVELQSQRISQLEHQLNSVVRDRARRALSDHRIGMMSSKELISTMDAPGHFMADYEAIGRELAERGRLFVEKTLAEVTQ